MLHYIKRKWLVGNKHSSLLGPFVNYEENEVLRIRRVMFVSGASKVQGFWFDGFGYIFQVSNALAYPAVKSFMRSARREMSAFMFCFVSNCDGPKHQHQQYCHH